MRVKKSNEFQNKNLFHLFLFNEKIGYNNIFNHQ